MTEKPTTPKLTHMDHYRPTEYRVIMNPSGKLSAPPLIAYAKTTCPDCGTRWWKPGTPPGHNTSRHDLTPAPCPICQQAREFAALPWWRKVLARIGGRR